MEVSEILDLIQCYYLDKWEKEVERSIPENFWKNRDKSKAKLLAECSEKALEYLNDYEQAMYDIVTEGSYLYWIKLLHMGIKIGMELRQGFDEIKEG